MLKKRTILYMTIICIIATLTGCWNYRESTSFLVVAGTAIDYDEENAMYTITTEVVNTKDEKLGTRGVIFRSKGKTVFDAIRNIIMTSDRRLLWAHIKLIIISEQVARNGLVSVLDLFYRDHEIRRDLYVLIADSPTASTIYDDTVYDNINKVNSFSIASVLESKKDLPVYYSSRLWDLLQILAGEGISSTLPMIRLKSDSWSKKIDVSGIAVFKKDKMVGKLSAEESMSFLTATNKLKGGILDITGKGDSNIALEIFSNNTNVKPAYQDKKISIVMDVSTTVNIAETNGHFNFNDTLSYKILEEDAEKTIEKNIKNIIIKVQREYQTDIFGFGAQIKRKMPAVWKKEKTNWDEIFTNLQVEVNAQVNIRGSAVRRRVIDLNDVDR